MMQLNRIGFEHATTGKNPDARLEHEPEYVSGYREGLIAKVKWAEEDLRCYEESLYWYEPAYT